MASKGMFFPTWPKEKECVFEGCICCYSICDLDTAKILICGRGEDLYICFEDKFCCVSGDTPFPVGLIKDDSYICKLGLYCYMCGLKNPDMKKLFACDYHCLCYKCIGQFPLGGKVEKPVCAYYGLSCLPEFGCFMPPQKPAGGAPPAAIEMAR